MAVGLSLPTKRATAAGRREPSHSGMAAFGSGGWNVCKLEMQRRQAVKTALRGLEQWKRPTRRISAAKLARALDARGAAMHAHRHGFPPVSGSLQMGIIGSWRRLPCGRKSKDYWIQLVRKRKALVIGGMLVLTACAKVLGQPPALGPGGNRRGPGAAGDGARSGSARVRYGR